MSRIEYKDWAVTSTGDVVGGSAVEVRVQSTGALADLYDAATSGSLLSNPLNAETDGSFVFFVEPGKYDVTVGSGASESTKPLYALRSDITYPTIAAMALAETAAVGDVVSVDAAFNGGREEYEATAGGLTADGALVVDGVGGQWVSKRTVYADFAEFIGDVRTFTAGTSLTVPIIGAAYQATESTGSLGRANAGGQEFDVASVGYSGHMKLSHFGPAADATTDDTDVIENFLAAGGGDGCMLTCATSGITVSSNQVLSNITLVGTSSSNPVLGVGEVGGGILYDNTNIRVKDVTVRGVGSYAFVFSNMTDFIIDGLKVTSFTASNDVVYLHRMYAGKIGNITVFGGTTAGASSSVMLINLGVNGIAFGPIYTSCFIKNGVTIQGNCASLSFDAPVLQGHSAAFNILDASGVSIDAPYTENCVNPFVIGAGAFSPKAIFVSGGGYISGFNPSHVFAADDNGVLVMLNRGFGVSFNDMMFSGVTSSSTGKQIASVNNGSVLNLRDPLTSSGDLTEVVTDFLRKEVGAAGTSGYYVEDTGAATGNNTARTYVMRTSAGGSGHVIEYRTGTTTVSQTFWTPTDNV